MEPRVRTAIAFLEKNLSRPLTASGIAQATELSPTHLRRIFKSETGVSPLQYLRRLRMERAKELVETSTLSVKEISAKVGLNDVSHFVRTFARTTGATPVEYRKQVRAEMARR